MSAPPRTADTPGQEWMHQVLPDGVHAHFLSADPIEHTPEGWRIRVIFALGDEVISNVVFLSYAQMAPDYD